MSRLPGVPETLYAKVDEMPGTQVRPADIGMEADHVPPETHRVNEAPSAAQSQSPTLHEPLVELELVPVPRGTEAEVAGVAGAAAEAVGEEAAWVAAADEAATVAKTPPLDCVI